jgi:outer membrane protein insertion porin family
MAGDLGYGLGDSGESGKELPLFERYFPGGINSNRGYQVRSLGPRQIVIERTNGQDCLRTTKGACDLDEIGASQQLMFNNELIFPVVPDAGLKMALFLDVGEGFLADDGIDLLKLRPATGAEVRWLSPLGPVRVSAGFPLDRREDDDSFVILFSFGTPF